MGEGCKDKQFRVVLMRFAFRTDSQTSPNDLWLFVFVIHFPDSPATPARPFLLSLCAVLYPLFDILLPCSVPNAGAPRFYLPFFALYSTLLLSRSTVATSRSLFRSTILFVGGDTLEAPWPHSHHPCPLIICCLCTLLRV